MQYNNKCPIWGTEANRGFINHDINEWESPRTGGKYKLDLPTFRRLEGTPLEGNEKVKLTDWLIAERKKGVESPLDDEKIIKYIKTQPEKPMSERIKDFMSYLVSAYALGEEFDILYGYRPIEPSQHYPMLAYSGSTTVRNLTAIASYCTNKGIFRGDY